MKIFCYMPSCSKFQNKVGMLTRAAGVDFQPCKNEEEAKIFAAQEKDGHFYLCIDARKTDFLKEFSSAFPSCKIIAILWEDNQNLMSKLMPFANIECFVSTHNGEFDIRELIAILKKFEQKDYPTLEKHLGFPSVTNEKKIKNQEDKKSVLTELEDSVLKLAGDSPKAKQYANRIHALANTLLLNAVHEGEPQLKTEAQDGAFSLPDKKEITIKWGFDGEVFGVSVIDPLGLLRRETVMQYLNAQHNIFESLQHLFVNVEPHKMTDIICLLRFEKKTKDSTERLRTFHYFRVDKHKKELAGTKNGADGRT